MHSYLPLQILSANLFNYQRPPFPWWKWFGMRAQGVTGGPRLSENLTEPAEKILPVRVIPVNTAALNPTADNMLQRSGGINAGSARHAGILQKTNSKNKALKIDRPYKLLNR
jgi:hypothetical protein